MAITEVTNKTRTNAIIHMDDKRFFGCVFTACTLRYAGGQCEWDKNTTFDKCTWEFLDSAQRTIQVLGLGTSGSFSMKGRDFFTH